MSMFNKLLRKKKEPKNKPGKLENVKSESSIFHIRKKNGNSSNMSSNPSNSTQTRDPGQSLSKDDMVADDIKRKQDKMTKSNNNKKRHSHMDHSIANRQHMISRNGKDNQRKKPPPPEKNGKRMNAMMTSTATSKRIEELMKMRGGGGNKKEKNGKRAPSSFNVPNSRGKSKGKSKNKNRNTSKGPVDKNQYQNLKRRSEVVTEPRRHSLLANKKKIELSRETFTRDRRKTIEKKMTYRKVQYRVKNEVFELYDYYEPRRIIGSGAYAVVCDATHTLSGEKVAIKKNKGVFDHITDARRILREIKLLMHFNHQDIMSLTDVIPPDLTEIENFNDVYLVMPKMETTLAKVIRSKQKLGDKHLQFFMYQMLRGLNYMHSANIIHRDLKPENILINGADCDIKITDFGLARGVCKDENMEQTEYVVTRWYRSPEVMCSGGQYDEKVDIWSLGCIFGELLLRKPLFPGGTYLEQLKLIFEVMGTPKDLSWIKTPEAKRWVQKLKPTDPKPLNKVFPAASMEALQLLSVMLVMDPNPRYSALQCLRHPYLKEYYRETDIVKCPPFDLSFEFEKAIKTKFGVRHMMYDALTEWKRKHPQILKTKNNNVNHANNDDQKNDK